jgi:hypothetical protein
VWNVALVKGTREEQGSQRTLTETDQTSYVSTKKNTTVATDNKTHNVKRKILQQKYLLLGGTTLITFRICNWSPDVFMILKTQMKEAVGKDGHRRHHTVMLLKY